MWWFERLIQWGGQDMNRKARGDPKETVVKSPQVQDHIEQLAAGRPPQELPEHVQKYLKLIIDFGLALSAEIHGSNNENIKTLPGKIRGQARAVEVALGNFLTACEGDVKYKYLYSGPAWFVQDDGGYGWLQQALSKLQQFEEELMHNIQVFFEGRNNRHAESNIQGQATQLSAVLESYKDLLGDDSERVRKIANQAQKNINARKQIAQNIQTKVESYQLSAKVQEVRTVLDEIERQYRNNGWPTQEQIQKLQELKEHFKGIAGEQELEQLASQFGLKTSAIITQAEELIDLFDRARNKPYDYIPPKK